MQRHDPETHEQKTRAHDRQQAQQEQDKHPTGYGDQLEGHGMAGQNVGPSSTERERPIPTAYDVKDVNRALADDFTDDDLKQIPILPTGTPLEQGATYVDLSASPREAFRINAGHTVRDGQHMVPKSKTPYEIWNRLVGRERDQSGTRDETDQKGGL